MNLPKVDKKGRILIPIETRKRLMIGIGDNIMLETDGKFIIGRKLRC